VVVHGNAGRGGDIDDRIGISACNGEGSYFGDKTLRMNDTSGATLDIIELLALLTPTQPRLGGWLILTSKGPPHLRRPFVPG
jgi:hypothetical protein